MPARPTSDDSEPPIAKKKRKPTTKHVTPKATPEISLVWQGPEYPRVQPGNYRAVCVSWRGPEYVRAFRRWSLMLGFSLLDDGTLICTFLNFGNQKAPQLPGQGSRFFREWSLANGVPPRKGEAMAFDTFTDPELIYTVRVEDCVNDRKGNLKNDALVYSRVEEILKVERGIF